MAITAGYEEDRHKVEKVLIEGIKKVPEVLEDPQPYVWISKFQDYAVEYRVFAFITDIKNMPRIDSDLHKAVLDAVTKANIDISTPLLHRKLTD